MGVTLSSRTIVMMIVSSTCCKAVQLTVVHTRFCGLMHPDPQRRDTRVRNTEVCRNHPTGVFTLHGHHRGAWHQWHSGGPWRHSFTERYVPVPNVTTVDVFRGKLHNIIFFSLSEGALLCLRQLFERHFVLFSFVVMCLVERMNRCSLS